MRYSLSAVFDMRFDFFESFLTYNVLHPAGVLACSVGLHSKGNKPLFQRCMTVINSLGNLEPGACEFNIALTVNRYVAAFF